jgi:hypothetical protein
VECRVKIKIVDWQDRDFIVALDVGLSDALRSGLEADSLVVAERVQIALRNDGYPDARIAYTRSVEDVLARVAHWTVWRNGTSVLIPAVGGPAVHTQSFH